MRQPSLAELDSAAPDNPVFLNGSFGGFINSKAMELSGINARYCKSGNNSRMQKQVHQQGLSERLHLNF